MTSPRAFVQYTHDTPEHREKVWQFVFDLRQAGVDARSDHDVDAPAEGWPRWMQGQVQAANFVLTVCTKNNARRVAGKEKKGQGKGATFEGLLLNQHVYEHDAKNSKVIPILLDGSGPAAVPDLLKPYTYYKLPKDWEKLLRRLTNQPALVAPPIGQIPVLPSRGSPARTSPTPAPMAAASVSRGGTRQLGQVSPAVAPRVTPAQTDVPKKLAQCLREFDVAAKEGASVDWKPVERWFTTWRAWFDHALPGEASRIRSLVGQVPPDPDFIKVGRQRVPVTDAFDDALANLRSEVRALIKKHVPATGTRRTART